MKWRKLGRVFCPDGSRWWARRYAHLPTAFVMDDVIRVFYAALDDDRIGRIGFVDLDARDPLRILAFSRDPVLDVGEAGMFDDSGVNPCALLPGPDGLRLYYIGWQRSVKTPYALFAGVAFWDEGSRSFGRVQRTPVLDRSPDEPYLRSALTVLREGGDVRAWYVCGIGWGGGPQGQHPRYVVNHLRSADGMRWGPRGTACIMAKDDDEYGFGRPWVLREAGRYHMWYSIRSRSAPYRIGYAESADGLAWNRRDERAGIARSDTGWDSEMICYPCVVDVAGRRFMFHNGNHHGESGFGVAILETD